MTSPSFGEIEESLKGFRAGRRPIIDVLVRGLTNPEICSDPFIGLSRFFCRLKSADSIVEKAKRKNLQIRQAAEIPKLMPDVLGFRIIVANQQELHAMKAYIKETFEVVRIQDHNAAPGEFGDRDIELSARYHEGGEIYPFEIQLRTFLQHCWFSQTFQFFHKKPKEIALAHKESIYQLAEVLSKAEQYVGNLPCETYPIHARAESSLLSERVRLIVVEPGERFAEQVTVNLNGQADEDHSVIVARKMALYKQFPNSAIVECACLDFAAFHLNEPLVRVSPEQIRKAVG